MLLQAWESSEMRRTFVGRPERKDNYIYMPFSVAVSSKAWVCGRSLAVIVGSNPAGGMNICVL